MPAYSHYRHPGPGPDPDVKYKRKISALLAASGLDSGTIDVNQFAQRVGCKPQTVVLWLRDMEKIGALRAHLVRPGVINVTNLDRASATSWPERLRLHLAARPRHRQPIVRRGEQVRVLQESLVPRDTGSLNGVMDQYYDDMGRAFAALLKTIGDSPLQRPSPDPDSALARRALTWVREHGLEDQL